MSPVKAKKKLNFTGDKNSDPSVPQTSFFPKCYMSIHKQNPKESKAAPKQAPKDALFQRNGSQVTKKTKKAEIPFKGLGPIKTSSPIALETEMDESGDGFKPLANPILFGDEDEEPITGDMSHESCTQRSEPVKLPVLSSWKQAPAPVAPPPVDLEEEFMILENEAPVLIFIPRKGGASTSKQVLSGNSVKVNDLSEPLSTNELSKRDVETAAQQDAVSERNQELVKHGKQILRGKSGKRSKSTNKECVTRAEVEEAADPVSDDLPDGVQSEQRHQTVSAGVHKSTTKTAAETVPKLTESLEPESKDPPGTSCDISPDNLLSSKRSRKPPGEWWLTCENECTAAPRPKQVPASKTKLKTSEKPVPRETAGVESGETHSLRAAQRSQKKHRTHIMSESAENGMKTGTERSGRKANTVPSQPQEEEEAFGKENHLEASPERRSPLRQQGVRTDSIPGKRQRKAPNCWEVTQSKEAQDEPLPPHSPDPKLSKCTPKKQTQTSNKDRNVLRSKPQTKNTKASRQKRLPAETAESATKSRKLGRRNLLHSLEDQSDHSSETAAHNDLPQARTSSPCKISNFSWKQAPAPVAPPPVDLEEEFMILENEAPVLIFIPRKGGASTSKQVLSGNSVKVNDLSEPLSTNELSKRDVETAAQQDDVSERNQELVKHGKQILRGKSGKRSKSTNKECVTRAEVEEAADPVSDDLPDGVQSEQRHQTVSAGVNKSTTKTAAETVPKLTESLEPESKDPPGTSCDISPDNLLSSKRSRKPPGEWWLTCENECTAAPRPKQVPASKTKLKTSEKPVPLETAGVETDETHSLRAAQRSQKKHRTHIMSESAENGMKTGTERSGRKANTVPSQPQEEEEAFGKENHLEASPERRSPLRQQGVRTAVYARDAASAKKRTTADASVPDSIPGKRQRKAPNCWEVTQSKEAQDEPLPPHSPDPKLSKSESATKSRKLGRRNLLHSLEDQSDHSSETAAHNDLPQARSSATRDAPVDLSAPRNRYSGRLHMLSNVSGPSSLTDLQRYQQDGCDSDRSPSRFMRESSRVLMRCELCGPPLQPSVLEDEDWNNLQMWFAHLWPPAFKSKHVISPDDFHWHSHEGRAMGHMVDVQSSSFSHGKILLGSYMKKPPQVDLETISIFSVISSCVRVDVEGVKTIYNSGGVFMIPSGQMYSIHNLCQEPAVLIYCRTQNTDSFS
ncbi:hypothetical protein DNTS_014575 [Danionella cerebrum]|uniref:Mif2/CENP-C cupin domain-containing protein n=1 Tax=Danionella cerebrum TaxID=2873325 RepID=A0A553QPR5_9TELE|nr:hypothetical protein DNTS_014575 [Danionella translucida]